MPEFILDQSGTVKTTPALSFADLDGFTQGYIEALFFTNTGNGNSEEYRTPEYQHRMREGQTDGELPNDVGFDALAPETLESIIRDCKAFQERHADLLEQAYGLEKHNGEAYDNAAAGRDFWFTRCGHGVGFWDRGLGFVGEKLSAYCGHGTEFRNLDVTFGDDDLIYLM